MPRCSTNCPCARCPRVPYIPIPDAPCATRVPCPVPPHAPLTSSTLMKTRSRFSARAPLTSGSVQFLFSSSATSMGYLDTSSRPVGTLCHPTALSWATPSTPSCPHRVQGGTAPLLRMSQWWGHAVPPHPIPSQPTPSPPLPRDPVVVPPEADSLGTSHLLHIVHVICGGDTGVSRAGGDTATPSHLSTPSPATSDSVALSLQVT